LEIRSLRRELAALHAAEQAALFEQAVLRERLAEADDLGAVEEAARERLGWVLPGEEKVVFVPPEEE
jgi:cell division protein FtsB